MAGSEPVPTHMGIAAGGQIKQKIYKDTRPTSLYDEETVERLWIHTVSTSMWEVSTTPSEHYLTACSSNDTLGNYRYCCADHTDRHRE